MIRNSNFEIVQLAEDRMAVPVGDEATAFHGVVALSEPAAYLLDLMKEPQTAENLVEKLLERYEIDRVVAEKDLYEILKSFRELNLILED